MPVTTVYFMFQAGFLTVKNFITIDAQEFFCPVDIRHHVPIQAVFCFFFCGIIGIAVRANVAKCFLGHDSLTAFAHVLAASAAIS